MPSRPAFPTVLAFGAGFLSAQAVAAQEIAPVAVDLIPGVVFAGAGGVELEEGPDGTPIATFWRPLQFERGGELLAGRMQCRAAAQREPYRAALFQLEQAHAARVEQGQLDGLEEIDTRSQPGDIVSRLDVAARASNPRRYEVLTYIAVRTGAELVNIRQTCQFLRDGNVYRQDFFRFVDRHTSFMLALPPPDVPDPATALSLDSLTDPLN